MDDLICTICNKFYDSEEKMPRLFPNCGHTFCSNCIKHLIEKNKEEIFCPEDNVKCEFYRESLGINAFPVNFALQKLLENSNKKKIIIEIKDNKLEEKEELENVQKVKELDETEIAYINARRGSRISDFSGINFCMDHQKIAELICLTDKCVICSDCVLFGNHNNHKYNKVIDFKKKVKNKINELEKREMEFRSNNEFDIFDEKRDYREFLKNKVLNSKNKLSEDIKINFDDLRDKLKKKESEIKKNISDLFLKFEDNLEIVKKGSEDIKKKNKDFSNNIYRIREELESKNPNFEFLLEKVYSKKYLSDFQKSIKRDISAHEKKTKELIEDELEKYNLETDLNPIINEIQNCFEIIVEDELKENKSLSLDEEDLNKMDQLDENENNEIMSNSKNKMKKINIDSEDFNLKKEIYSDSLDEKSDLSDKSEEEEEINYENQKMKKNTSFLTKEQKEENDRKLFSSKNILNNLYSSNIRNDNINFNPPENNFFSNTPNLYSKNVSSNLYESNINKSGIDLKTNNFYDRTFNKSRKKSFRELSLKKPMKSSRNIGKKLLSRKNTDIIYSKMNITDNLLFNIIKDIRKDPNVKFVDLSYNQISSKGFDNILKKLYNHPTLEKINLKCNFLDEKIFKSLNNYSSKLVKLKYFNIQENKISKKKSSVKMAINNIGKYGIKIKIY